MVQLHVDLNPLGTFFYCHHKTPCSDDTHHLAYLEICPRHNDTCKNTHTHPHPHTHHTLKHTPRRTRAYTRRDAQPQASTVCQANSSPFSKSPRQKTLRSNSHGL